MKLPSLLTLFAAFLPAVAAGAQQPNLHGIAHVAYGVHNYEAEKAFYNSLGFEQAFAFNQGTSVRQGFIKINDRQFIELYPVLKPTDHLGFLHVCFDADDIVSNHAFYIAHGVAASPVVKAHAGNLLFHIDGPEHHLLEYTQYQPGSLHSNDRGLHLSPSPVAGSIAAIVWPMQDSDAATAFFTGKLGFTPRLSPTHANLQIPGSTQALGIVSAKEQSAPILELQVASLKAARAYLHAHKVPVSQEDAHSLMLRDPDGNMLLLVTAP